MNDKILILDDEVDMLTLLETIITTGCLEKIILWVRP